MEKLLFGDLDKTVIHKTEEFNIETGKSTVKVDIRFPLAEEEVFSVKGVNYYITHLALTVGQDEDLPELNYAGEDFVLQGSWVGETSIMDLHDRLKEKDYLLRNMEGIDVLALLKGTIN